jgi:hypothetical protein
VQQLRGEIEGMSGQLAERILGEPARTGGGIV